MFEPTATLRHQILIKPRYYQLCFCLYPSQKTHRFGASVHIICCFGNLFYCPANATMYCNMRNIYLTTRGQQVVSSFERKFMGHMFDLKRPDWFIRCRVLPLCITSLSKEYVWARARQAAQRVSCRERTKRRFCTMSIRILSFFFILFWSLPYLYKLFLRLLKMFHFLKDRKVYKYIPKPK